MRNSALERHVGICRLFYHYGRLVDIVGKNGDGISLSVAQVAFWLNMRPSGYLMGRLRECVELGYLAEQKSFYRANIVASRFSLLDKGRNLAIFYEEHRS